MNFKQLNNYIGWALFALSAIVYMLTVEPTVSLWDCGEYIATSYKLEVGHPPGAPLFMMLGRLFSFTVGAENVAYAINMMSALCSAFTILFLFWTITMVGRKIAYGGYSGAFNIFNRNVEKKSDLLDEDVINPEQRQLSDGAMWAILGSGIVGALAYTFSDSFWFSAVEAEVYAMSSFFTALVFWAGYKWDFATWEYENGKTDRHPDRWLIFIMFMVGLSIGVHLLNLLAIPAIAYIIYFNKFKNTSLKGFVLTGVIALATLVLIQDFIIPKTVSIGSAFEVAFVNGFGMPFGSGQIFFALFITAILVFAWRYTKIKGKVNANTAVVSLMVLFIGYSCFAMIPIRSNANPPVDENNPETLPKLNSYLLREQYGDWPLLYGPYWMAPRDVENKENWEDRSPVYERGFAVVKDDETVKGFSNEKDALAYAKKIGGSVEEKYYVGNINRFKQKPTYDPEFSTFFPRMYQSYPEDDPHYSQYIYWSGYDKSDEGREFKTDPYSGGTIYKPFFSENLTYFFDYQVGHMYFRYLFWNFVGKQNDSHNQKNQLTEGNWLSGINFIDAERLGPQDNLPEHRANEESRNTFFYIPLILILIGMFYHLYKSPKDWWVVFLLFIFTGFMIVIYLNQKPLEPRERDYAYAGSFYVLTIWLGLAVYAIYDFAKRFAWKNLQQIAMYSVGFGVAVYLVQLIFGAESFAFSYSLIYIGLIGTLFFALMMALKGTLKDAKSQAIAATLICFSAPLLMGIGGWDDHDRSGRYGALEMARNYLNTCEKNAIMFTNGDNDTFPLWYAQEVEEIRTDVRTVNLSLLTADWYAEQMKRKAYHSDPLPITFTEDELRQGASRDYVFVGSTRILGGLMHYNQTFNANAIKNIQKWNGKEMDIRDAIKFLQYNEETGEENLLEWDGDKIAYLPTNKFYLPVDKEAFLKNINKEGKPKFSEEELANVADTMHFTIGGMQLYKSSMLILDMVANNNWERPIYYAGTGGNETYLGLQNYFRNEGLAYLITPIPVSKGGVRSAVFPGYVDTDKVYELYVNQFKWGGIEKEDVFLDYYHKRPFSNYRLQYYSLADALVKEKQFEKAYKTIEKCMAYFPDKKVPFDGMMVQVTSVLNDIADGTSDENLKNKAIKLGNKIIEMTFKNVHSDFNYFISFPTKFAYSRKAYSDVWQTVNQSHRALKGLAQVYSELNDLDSGETTKYDNAASKSYTDLFTKLSKDFQSAESDYYKGEVGAGAAVTLREYMAEVQNLYFMKRGNVEMNKIKEEALYQILSSPVYKDLSHGGIVTFIRSEAKGDTPEEIFKSASNAFAMFYELGIFTNEEAQQIMSPYTPQSAPTNGGNIPGGNGGLGL